MKKKIVLLILVFFSISCRKQKLEIEKTITISGKLISNRTKIVYLKMIDNFNYLGDNYIVDSTMVSNEGEFKFKVNKSSSNLLSLSITNKEPFSYRVLREIPDKYYFGSCAKFFAAEPTFYVSANDSINIDWFNREGLDSVIHKTHLKKTQNLMYQYYSNAHKSVAANLYEEDSIDYETAWNKVIKDQENKLKLIDTFKIRTTESFENYMYTEIVLNNMNIYLNWFENKYPNRVNSAILNSNNDNFYNQILTKYSNHLWNSKSFEYYKFTERFVNYHMNLKNQIFKTYYEPTKEKKQIAKKVLKGKNRKLYLSVLEKQIRNNALRKTIYPN